MRKIVSRNYRDRQSNEPWLIRDENQTPGEAIAVKTVYATGVAFCPSSDFETGFGCSTVAFCDTAETAVPAGITEGEALSFEGHAFFMKSTGKYVPHCSALILRSDRKMFLGIPVNVETPVLEHSAELVSA